MTVARAAWLAGLSALVCANACGSGPESGDGGAEAGTGGGEVSGGSGGRGGGAGIGGASDEAGGEGAQEAGAGGVAGAAGTASTGGGPPMRFGMPETLIGGLDYPVRLALDSEWVYLTVRGSLATNNGSLVRVRKDGSGSETLADGRNAPFALALDDGAVYWTEVPSSTQGGVYRLRPGDGAARVFEVTGSATALFVDAERIYFGTTAASGGAVVSWTTKAGAALGSLTGFTGVFDIVPHTSRSWVLLLDAGDVASGATSAVRAIDAGGAQVNAVELEPNGVQDGIVLDERLLFTSPARASVASLALDDAPGAAWAVEDLVLDLEQPWGIAADERFIYYSERAEGVGAYCAAPDGAVRALDRANPATPITLASGLNCPSRIAVDDSGVYFVTNGVDGTSMGSVVRIPLLN